ncbi:MAG: tetratricopeptide repeat protein [Patescibacteria group bacterium]
MLKNWRPYLIIFFFGFLLYSKTLFFDFSYFDDNALILDNAPILSQMENIGHIFLSDVFLTDAKYYYRPLLNLSLMFDFKIAGSLPFIFHLSNILLHILASILVFILFIKLNYKKQLAFFFSLLFLSHPVLVQAVAWIPGRNDSLLTVFILAAFISFLNFKEKPKLFSYLAYLGFLLLALFTKETAAMLPAVIIFYFLAVEPKKISSTDKYLLIGGSLAIGFIWYLFRRLALGSDPLTDNLIINSLISTWPAFFISLGKIIWPFNLSVLPILKDSSIISGLLFLPLLVAALLFSKNKRFSYLVYGAIWFFLFIFPSFIRLNPLNTPDFLEHRLYLPLIGFLIILGEIDFIKNLNFRKLSVKIITSLLILFFAFLTYSRLADFKDRISFWQSAVKNSPHSPLAHRNLGAMYYLDGRLLESEQEYQKTIALNDNEPMVHNNLGVIYLNQKKFKEAETEFNKELEVNPGYDKAILNLADLKYRIEHNSAQK